MPAGKLDKKIECSLPAARQAAGVLAKVSLEQECDPRPAHRNAEDERTLKQNFGPIYKKRYLHLLFITLTSDFKYLILKESLIWLFLTLSYLTELKQPEISLLKKSPVRCETPWQCRPELESGGVRGCGIATRCQSR